MKTDSHFPKGGGMSQRECEMVAMGSIFYPNFGPTSNEATAYLESGVYRFLAYFV